jgi:hypothetical protein
MSSNLNSMTILRKATQAARAKDKTRRSYRRILTSRRYSDVNNPKTQWVRHDEKPKSRAEIIQESGALKSISNFDIQKELQHLQSERAAFVAWQANQSEFVMHKFVMYDSDTGMDRWDPITYSFYPLTLGQWRAVQMQEAKERDLQRSLDDKDVKDAHQQLALTQIETLKLKCGLFFRMNIDESSEGYEFEYINWPDLRDAVEAATYKNAFPSQNRGQKYKAGIG